MSLNQGNNSNTNQPMAKRPRVSSTPLPSIELQPSTPNNPNNNVTNVRELPRAVEIHKNQQSSDHIPVASSPWWPNRRRIIASTTSINANTGRVPKSPPVKQTKTNTDNFQVPTNHQHPRLSQTFGKKIAHRLPQSEPIQPVHFSGNILGAALPLPSSQEDEGTSENDGTSSLQSSSVTSVKPWEQNQHNGRVGITEKEKVQQYTSTILFQKVKFITDENDLEIHGGELWIKCTF
jgi:hypothetical protein